MTGNVNDQEFTVVFIVSIMNAVEDYAKRWAKRENEELNTVRIG
jgi:hypothetical protein